MSQFVTSSLASRLYDFIDHNKDVQMRDISYTNDPWIIARNPNVEAYEDELLEYATEELANIEGTRFIGQAPKRNGLISFVIDGIHPYDLGTIIDKIGVAVRTGHHCAEPVMTFFGIPGTVRASFAMYNTKEEIDIFVKAVERAANMLK